MMSIPYYSALVIQVLIFISATSLQSISPSQPSLQFLLTFQTPSRSNQPLQQQQQSNPERYITADGKATNDCRLSANYSIDPQGQLRVDGAQILSTSEGTVSQSFIATSSEGKIKGTWQTFFGMLQWRNEAFIGGTATVCLERASGLILVYFLERAPLTCRPLTLHLASISACSDGGLSGSAPTSSKNEPTSISPESTSSETSHASTANGRSYLSTMTTTTTTTTGQATTQPTPSPAYGLAYNAYINPFNIENDLTWRDDFAAMGPSYFNNNSNYLLTCGIAHDIRIYNDDIIYPSINGYLPCQTVLTDLEHIAVIFHGSFLSPEAGTYTFTANSDDWGYIWLGSPTALTAWNEGNWIASDRAGGPTVSGSFTVASAGELVPTTILYANAGQRCACDFSIMFPNGTQTSDFTGLFVQPTKDTWGEWSPAVQDPRTCPLPIAYTDGNGGDS